MAAQLAGADLLGRIGMNPRLQSPIVALPDNFGWVQLSEPGKPFIAFKGFLTNAPALQDAARYIRNHLATVAPSEIDTFLAQLDGHFAFVFANSEHTLLAVDRVRSIPLLFAMDGSQLLITDHAGPLRARQLVQPANIDSRTSIEFAMAGYTLGRKTLYKNIETLIAGERAIVAGTGKITRSRYAFYRPWLAEDDGTPDTKWRQRLRETTLNVLEKLVATAGQRQILVPLSAGLDSRLIVSGLRHLGARDVVCFSYGRTGNHEAEAARAIAGRLGYDWHFISMDTARFRKARKTEAYRRYFDLVDNLISTPVEQDVYPVMQLKQLGWAAHDAIVVNGQSGDFISGGHIPQELEISLDKTDWQARKDLIVTANLQKHFGLWPALQTDATIEAIAAEFDDELRDTEAPIESAAHTFALYEFLEYQNRQSKYVLGNQRSYEAFGYDWRLPLWDSVYLSFWQTVPLRLKARQKLYRDMLIEADWGSVWSTLLPAPRWITPPWIRPIRFAAKIACAPFGQAAWHRFERRVFNHVMDPLRKYAAVSWWTVAFCAHDHRSAISWLTAQYLNRHGLDWAGRRL